MACRGYFLTATAFVYSASSSGNSCDNTAVACTSKIKPNEFRLSILRLILGGVRSLAGNHRSARSWPHGRRESYLTLKSFNSHFKITLAIARRTQLIFHFSPLIFTVHLPNCYCPPKQFANVHRMHTQTLSASQIRKVTESVNFQHRTFNWETPRFVSPTTPTTVPSVLGKTVARLVR